MYCSFSEMDASGLTATPESAELSIIFQRTLVSTDFHWTLPLPWKWGVVA